jgi:hypothetical protein
VNPTDVEGKILTHEGAYAAHVVAVIGMLVTAETVYIWTKHIVNGREPVEIGACMSRIRSIRGKDIPVWTHSTGKEQTKI